MRGWGLGRGFRPWSGRFAVWVAVWVAVLGRGRGALRFRLHTVGGVCGEDCR